MEVPKVVIFDLLTALLDSWRLWDVTAGSAILGRRWRARYLALTYGSGAYRPYEELVAEAALEAGLPAPPGFAPLREAASLDAALGGLV
jgi:2-haloacid dehalogenase